ncbi:MAG: hypothetical protein HC828_10210 [Blastochloris sp.]|nr:hypothetical protein [Blastochloris sp.]
MILLAGAIATAVLGAWVRHLTFSEGMFILREDQTVLGTVSHWQVGLVMLGVVINLPAVVYLLVRDGQLQSALVWAWSWIKHHPWWSLVLLIGMMLGAVDGYEFLYDPYRKQWGPYPYRIRDDLQNWLWFGSALLGGLGLMKMTGGNLSGWLAGCDQTITENATDWPGSRRW